MKHIRNDQISYPIKFGGLMKGLASNWLRCVVVAMLTSLLVVGSSPVARPEEDPSAASLIVRTVQGLSAEDQQAVIQRNGGVETSGIPQLNLHIVEVPAVDLEAIMQNYREDPEVVSVELNTKRKVGWLPNDGWLADQWDLFKISWDLAYGDVAVNGAGYVAKIAIIDTGVEATHPDLANVVMPGMSIFDSESNGMTDPHGHGTWLAGIAAAQTNNGEGIAGIAYGGVKIMPVQVINADGEGQDGDIIAGVMWAVEHGADVILMGFSNPGYSENLQLAIDYAWENDVVLVAAVGNDGLGEPTYPAGDEGVMGVSATDQEDALASFSNFGPATFIGAPGVSMMSTTADGVYAAGGGSSASSAVVAGAAALLRAVDPTLTNGVIVGRLARNADPAGDPDPEIAQTQVGNGRINLDRALRDTSTEEVKPTGAPGGGPFVGPYHISSVTSVTITSPTNVNPAMVTSLPATVTIAFNYVTSSTGTTTGTADILGTGASASKSLLPGNGSNSIAVTIPAGTANGSYNVKVTVTNSTGSGSNNKNDNQNAAMIIRIKANATCTITGYSGVYDGNAHGASGSCTGAGGVTLSGLSLGATFRNSPGGTAHWEFAGGTGYNDQSGDVAITISKADANCTVSGYSGVYDAAAHGASGSCSGIGGESAGTMDLGASFTIVPGGTAHWVFTGNGNYNDHSGDVTITISKANATCTVSGYSGVYDAASHGASGSCSGIGGESAGTLNLGDIFTNVPGGTAHWTFAGNGNYNDQSGDAAITISKADATCTVSGYSGVYDAEAHGASGSCSGIGGENAGTLHLGLTFTDVPGGTANWSFTGGTNYNDQSGDVVIVISKADATVTVNGYTGIYDAAAHGATGTATGVGDVDLSAGLNLGASFTDVPGGTAHWTFSGRTNYNDQSGDVAITITKADATCSVNRYSGVYDAEAHGANGSCSGIGGENAGTLSLGASFTNVPGGTAHWVFIGNGNYKDQNGDVAITISKADATCSISGHSGVYDAAAHGASGSCSGIGGESAGTLDLGANFTNVPGGTAHWTFTGNGNYNDQSDDVTIAIAKATLTVAAINQTKILNAPNPVFTYSHSGWKGQDTLAVLDTQPNCYSIATTTSPVGFYLITCEAGNDNNYSFAYVNGTLHVIYATSGTCYGAQGHQILQPINSDGTSVFKQKSTIPAKFRVCDAHASSIDNPGVVKSFRLLAIGETNATEITEIVDSTTPDTSFRWSATDQQWIFNISTKSLTAGKTYLYRIALNDDSLIDFQFTLK